MHGVVWAPVTVASVAGIEDVWNCTPDGGVETVYGDVVPFAEVATEAGIEDSVT